MIGLFDSGVGGLSVLKALEQLLPHTSFIYFSDSAHFPYGKKSAAELIRYTSQITSFLLSHEVEMVVVPCHTASALALPALREIFPVPMVGMIEPTIQALKETGSKKIGLMGTEGTINSGIYQMAIGRELPGSTVFPLTCPPLEQKIELGETDAQDLIKQCLKPILGQGVDTLLLACTHYPHLRKEIEEELYRNNLKNREFDKEATQIFCPRRGAVLIDTGRALDKESVAQPTLSKTDSSSCFGIDPETVVLDPALSVAAEVQKMVKEQSGTPKHLFYTSGDLEIFKRFLETHPPKGKYFVEKFIQQDQLR